MQDTALLEARLADLADVVARLEGRVAALERTGPQARRSAAQAALDRSATPSRESPGAFDAGEATRVLSLGGRTLLVLAGAFVLRAVTDSGSIPSWMGVGLGFLYAGAWMIMADRAGKAGQTLSAAFHAISVVIIGFPLLIEGTNRFKLFSPVGAAAVLTALTAAALLLATRRGLPSLAWVVSLGGTATAIWLMATSKVLVPGALYLVALGTAAAWIGYIRDWTGIRWPVALVADLVPEHLRGTAYGTYNAVIGILAFPASFIAGLLWQGAGAWSGFGPSAPFLFGGSLALIAALMMSFWMPKTLAEKMG